LLFNEGYHASNHESTIRFDLCEEAMRLNYLLLQSDTTRIPKVQALMALMCLQASRFPSRHHQDGSVILLEQQDRSLWNQELIQRGLLILESASRGEELSDYHIEATIASIHAEANSFEDTDWKKLLMMYEFLAEFKPSPLVAMNKAIACGYACNAELAIRELLMIKGLEQNHFYHAALGNFYHLANKKTDALKSYQTALSLSKSANDAKVIEGKIGVLKCSANS
jgi:RNA polymerase sigma-70 factor (ECF subfamily)